MFHKGKLVPPNMHHQNSTKLLNLKVLRRIDPFIEEILITAAHVTLYEFNIEISQWSRKDVEGSLFVVKRNRQQPRFQFIVMNRRNTDNLVEDLLGDFEYEVQGPYLLYRNAAQEVNGIWFYNQRECEDVARLFGRLLSAYSKVNQKPNLSSSKREFEDLEAVPTVSVMDGSLEPSSSGRDAPDDSAFVNFFSSAMSLGNTTSGSACGPPYQSSANPHQPTISSPAAAAAPPQILSPPPLPSSSSLTPLFDNNPDRISSNSNVHTAPVTPSSFFGPPGMMAQPHLIPGSSMTSAPPLNLNNTTYYQQRTHGTPMPQPFPPPSLAPVHNSPGAGGKIRRKASRYREHRGDYLHVSTRPGLMKILEKQGDTSIRFADKVLKFTGTGKMKRRIFILTDFAIYLIDPESEAMTRRIGLAAVEKVCLSKLSDNFFAVIIPTEYDLLMASTRKTELVQVMVDVTKSASDYELEVLLSNRFEYNASASLVKEVSFEEAEGGIKTSFKWK